MRARIKPRRARGVLPLVAACAAFKLHASSAATPAAFANIKATMFKVKFTAPAPAASAKLPPVEAPLQPDDAQILLGLAADLVAVSSACAVVLSCCNVMQFERQPGVPETLGNYVPATTVRSVGGTVGRLIDSEMRASLSGLTYYLESGRQILLAIVATDDPLSRSQVLELFDSFKTAAIFTKMCNADVARLVAEYVSSEAAGKLITASQGLDDVLNGGSPFFKAGAIVHPVIEGRIVHQRMAVKVNAALLVEGREIPVVVADISKRGVRVLDAGVLKAGTVVALEVPGGARLPGVVRWNTATATGLELDAPLPEDSPLLAAVPARA